MNGLWHRYLDVDLTAGTVRECDLPNAWATLHLGGRGLGARLLLQERLRLGSAPDPLGDENPLLFMTGPLQGIAMPGSGKHVMMSWSPKTKMANESYAGGAFGFCLARTGYDAVLIRGQAVSPCYLLVTEQGPSLEEASDLWGLTTKACETQLRKQHGEKTSIASIGPAGENLVRFACVIHDSGHAAGRPGFGAVMGSKRLKAILLKGARRKPVKDPDRLREAVSAYSRLTLSNPGIQNFMTYGTSAGVAFYNEMGTLPTRNFQEGAFTGAGRISAEAINRKLLKRREACAGCAVRCRPIVRVGDEEFEGPEYETLAGFGSLCLIDDLEAIAQAHHRSNLYGIDAISAGVIAAFVMEISEKGLLPPQESLSWGDGEGLLTLIDRIAQREGRLGEILAEGLVDAAARLGSTELAVHVKGVELPLHDPRGKKGLAISYATSPRGATHLEAMHDEMFEGPGAPTPEIGVEEPLDRFSWEGKPNACKAYEDLYSFVNSAIVCGFVSWNQSAAASHYPFGALRDVLNAITGLEIDAAEMQRIGERNYLIRRLLTGMDGHVREMDRLPPRLMQPLQTGASKGERISGVALQEAIDEYYRLRGMDSFGPTDRTLETLGMGELVGLIPRS